jgi:preprotein translocase subunit SecE
VGAVQHLLSVEIYKRTQGRIVRQVTFAALVVTVVLGCWRLSQSLQGTNPYLEFVLPAVLAAVGSWICYRLVNVPRFADFLISVEGEMNKVSWPSRAELFRSAVVVLMTIFLLTVVLFVYDLFWRMVLDMWLNVSNMQRA